jgi:hypothetical protein
MVNISPEYLENLKTILENSLHPELLDSHPWTSSPIMQEVNTDALQNQSPGQQLVLAVSRLFTQMMPSTPPKRGKRLDTNWGEFGILAAQYFAPLLSGSPRPESLRDAWGHIDQSILLFVFGKQEGAPSDADKEKYRLVGNELEVAPISTLSDWQRKGIQRLAEVILAREKYLSTSASKTETTLDGEQAESRAGDTSPSPETKDQNGKIKKSGRRRFFIPLLILVLLGLVLIGGLKVWKIYGLAMQVYQDTARIQEVIRGPTSKRERINAVGPALANLRNDFTKLKDETESFFWMGPWLKWVPVYGGELASIQDLAALADSLLASADISYQAVSPLVAKDGLSDLTPSRLTEIITQAQPQLVDVQQQLDQAVAARKRLDPDSLSPRVHDLILNDVDPLLGLMQDGLTVAMEFPRLMGATSEGPKTYLLLVQNEDELRPTGGFITAAGTLLVKNGSLSNLSFKSSEYFDNWDRPYLVAPWQLSQYMNSRVLIFRDTNWFTSYPTAALYAEYLYSYTSSHSVDGVIAFDQQLLVEILSVTGPIEVEGAPYLIDAGNVTSYMRTSKTPTAEDLASPDWNNKIFINRLTRALFTKMFSGDVQWEELVPMLLQGLNEHNLLIQLDSPTMTSFLERYHWDGAIRPGINDFLMVVDSNVGFNKTNAVVETKLSYDVDLTNLQSPTASLTVFHKNNSADIGPCKQWNKVRAKGEKDYPITDCYWDYLRVYILPDTYLLDATVQTVPAAWMILNRTIPPQVDVLDEGIDGVRSFGTLKVVPGGQSRRTNFRLALPSRILETLPDSKQMTYRLKIQKQPGTLVPITLRVQLPDGAKAQSVPSEATVKGQTVLAQITLRIDTEVEITFLVP